MLEFNVANAMIVTLHRNAMNATTGAAPIAALVTVSAATAAT